jgi:hypothetical protein
MIDKLVITDGDENLARSEFFCRLSKLRASLESFARAAGAFTTVGAPGSPYTFSTTCASSRRPAIVVCPWLLPYVGVFMHWQGNLSVCPDRIRAPGMGWCIPAPRRHFCPGELEERATECCNQFVPLAACCRLACFLPWRLVGDGWRMTTTTSSTISSGSCPFHCISMHHFSAAAFVRA